MPPSKLLALIASLASAAPLAACRGPGDEPCFDEEISTVDQPVPSPDAAFEMYGPDAGPLTCAQVCGPPTLATLKECSFGTDDAGAAVAHCTWDTPAHCGMLTGRRYGVAPLPRAAPAATEAAALFARLAQLEAASVGAFAAVARELRAYGAPAGLVREAVRAAKEELRHARVMRDLARREGARASRSVRPARAARTLEAFATENAVEGCVRETFGALLAAWQARAAADPEVRGAMASVAPDEARHAALAHAIARWAARRLDREARARVERARRDAIEELRAELARPPSPALAVRVGLPAPDVALSLAASLFAPRAA